MHLPRAAPRDGRAVEFRVVFLQRRFAPVKGGLMWASAQPNPGRFLQRELMAELLPFRVATGDLLDEIDDPAPQLGIGNAHEGLG